MTETQTAENTQMDEQILEKFLETIKQKGSSKKLRKMLAKFGKEKATKNFSAGKTKPTLRARARKYNIQKKKQKLARKANR